MVSFLEKDFKLTIQRDPSNKLSVKSKVLQTSQDHFFEKLSKELKDLAKEYGKEMDELHMLFMEVCCDIGELKKVLRYGSGSSWTMLEDLALQREPDSMEFKHICDSKGGSQVNKRKKFLEIQK